MRKEVYKTPTTQVYPLQVEGYMLTDSQRKSVWMDLNQRLNHLLTAVQKSWKTRMLDNFSTVIQKIQDNI